jgi:hypothetical protein
MISENFFAHCDLSAGPDACWPYLRAKNKKGYGQVWVDGKCEEAHRFAYTQSRGAIPDGLCVLHKCDFPSCCNPKHLWIGTKFDNNRDREEKGRGNQPHGEVNGQSKLTTRQVVFIRRCRDLFNTYEMAQMIGVTPATITRVLNGGTWKWLDEMPSFTSSICVSSDRHIRSTILNLGERNRGTGLLTEAAARPPAGCMTRQHLRRRDRLGTRP